MYNKFCILKQVDESILLNKIEEYRNSFAIEKDWDGKTIFIPYKEKPDYIVMSYKTQCALNKNKSEHFKFLPPSCKNAEFLDIPVLTYNQLAFGEVILI